MYNDIVCVTTKIVLAMTDRPVGELLSGAETELKILI